MSKVCCEPTRKWVVKHSDNCEAVAVESDSEGKARALGAREWGLTFEESSGLDVRPAAPASLDCPRCGALVLHSEDGLFYEGRHAECSECGVCSVVTFGGCVWLREVEE